MAIIEAPSRVQAPVPRSGVHSKVRSNGAALSSEIFDSLQKHRRQGHLPKLSERLYLVATTIGILASIGAVSDWSAATFLLHSALQTQLSLSQRHLTNIPAGSSFLDGSITPFAHVCLLVVNSYGWSEFLQDTQGGCDVGDLVDGRLFKSLLRSKNPLELVEIADDTMSLLHNLMDLTSTISQRRISVADLARKASPSDTTTIFRREISRSITDPISNVAQFSNPVLNKYLGPLELSIGAESGFGYMETHDRVYQERYHWHKAGHLIQKPEPSIPSLTAESRLLCQNQRYISHIVSYATRLAGIRLKALPHTQNSQSSGVPSSTSGPTPNTCISMAQDTDMNAASPAGSDFSVPLTSPSGRSSDSELSNRATSSPSSTHSGSSQLDGAVHTLRCILESWARSSERPDIHTAERILQEALRLKGSQDCAIATLSDSDVVAHDPGSSLSSGHSPSSCAPLPPDSAPLPATAEDAQTSIPPREFQLVHSSPLLARDVGQHSQKERLEREALDAIDHGKSLLVIDREISSKPTPFNMPAISDFPDDALFALHAMEKVLSGSEDHVLVYVAPVKARVKRIAAEIQARFSEEYKSSKRPLWAVHTREFRVNDSTNCRILVTVPAILHILLLTPTHAQTWLKNVKYAIFDDTHCGERTKDHQVWEQLFLLLPCPIISLSTNVANPRVFREWLSYNQTRKGRDLVVIHQRQRDLDIRSFVFLHPSEDPCFLRLSKPQPSSPVSLDDVSCFEFLHPIACLAHRYVFQ